MCNLHRKKTLINPRTNKTLELEDFSHPLLYPTLASLEQDEMEANEAADAAAELEATTAPAAEVPAIEATATDAADGEQASVETQAALAADALPPVLTRDTVPACSEVSVPA